MRKQFRDFKSARKFVQKLGLKSGKYWREYVKSGNKPDEIPSAPWSKYEKEWEGMGDWLGTGRIADQYKKYRSFNDAIKYTHSLNLKSQKEWQMFCISGNKPDDIPSLPNRRYKNKGWNGYGDWLGTKSIATQDTIYRSFNNARKFARNLKLQRQNDWHEYCKSGNKPDDIPRNPQSTYKKEWGGMGNFLGTDRIASQDMVYRPYKKAHKFVQQLNLKNGKEWTAYCKSGNKPQDIPYDAKKVYKKEWKGMGDWLGTGTIASYNMVYRSFEDARKFAQKFKFQTNKEWQKYCKSGKLPKDIPNAPTHQYKNKGWVNWGDFLGTGTISNTEKSQNYLPWPEAKIEYQKLAKQYDIKNGADWKEFSSKHKKELEKLNLPSNPKLIYTKERTWNEVKS